MSAAADDPASGFDLFIEDTRVLPLHERSWSPIVLSSDLTLLVETSSGVVWYASHHQSTRAYRHLAEKYFRHATG
jgi:hypothetical protein